MKMISLFAIIVLLLSCSPKKSVDLIVHNARVYTVDDTFSVAQAFAVNDGKFIEVGSSKDILKRYEAKETIDAHGQTILPGFIDAHCHFYSLGIDVNRIDLTGTESFEEVVQRVVDFQKVNNEKYIIGRGWDQNDWETKEFPEKKLLDSLFPNIPVALSRIDGHAMIVNEAALRKAGITLETPVFGGEIIRKKGSLTGLLIDNPMELVYQSFPKQEETEIREAHQQAEKICFDLGLTSIDDAGLDRQVIEVIEKMHADGSLKMRIYAMVSNTPDNLDYYLNKGIIKTDRLNVRSIKVYGDGALGSRGAALKKEYSDKPGHHGALLADPGDFHALAHRIALSDYQMNSHAIGDSANIVMLKAYARVLKGKNNRRWRIEHAQIIDLNDLDYFENYNIIPSVQPTHATSDMYWVESRIGPERMPGAYSYQSLLKKAGRIALGTDFPVEMVNPMFTFYAAVARKDLSGRPAGGFQMKEALNRNDALRGMTIWAAYANFEEEEKGSIKAGKFADFIVIDQDIMEIEIRDIPLTQVKSTWVGGELVSTK